MATRLDTSFTRWKLSSDELISGALLSTQQIQIIQNLICDAAEERLSLIFDPVNPSSFIQREAELHGQIGILKFLLANNESAINDPKSLASDVTS